VTSPAIRSLAPLRAGLARLRRLPFVDALWADVALAFRNVLRQRRRSFVGIVSVAFGVVALLLAAGFIEWIYWAMREDTIRTGLGHVQVVRKGYFDGGLADPFAFLLPAQSPELASLERWPGVKTLSPRLAFSGLASLGDTTISFIAEAMDPAREGELAGSVAIEQGEPLAADRPREIIMGRGLAANLGVKVGDTVVLVANTRSGGINAVETKVRGLFSTITKAYDDAALRVPLVTAQELLRVTGAHRWVVLLNSTAATPATTADFRAQLDPKRFDVVPWYELADFYNKTVELFSKQVNVMKLIIALIIVLSISNTQTMTVLERTSEIGTSMALGVTRAQTLRRFLLESLVIGIVGGLVGLALGMVLAKLISLVGIPMPPPPGMARGFVGQIRVTWGLAGDAITLALVTTLLAGLYPAWKASRMQIVDALRHAR
jgi:putative ABC transport system permease protein